MQAVCHWLFVSWIFFSRFVRSLIWIEFSSKNSVLNCSILVCGIGLSSGGVLVGVVGGGRAIKVFGGMCRVMGK